MFLLAKFYKMNFLQDQLKLLELILSYLRRSSQFYYRVLTDFEL